MRASFDKSLKLQNEVLELALAVNSSICSKSTILSSSLSLYNSTNNLACYVRHHLFSLCDDEESWNLNGVRLLTVTSLSDSLGRLYGVIRTSTLSVYLH